MRGGGRGDVAPSPRERTVLAWGRPLIAKEMPIVIRLHVISALAATGEVVGGGGRALTEWKGSISESQT